MVFVGLIKTTQFSAPRKTFVTREVMGKYQKHEFKYQTEHLTTYLSTKISLPIYP